MANKSSHLGRQQTQLGVRMSVVFAAEVAEAAAERQQDVSNFVRGLLADFLEERRRLKAGGQK